MLQIGIVAHDERILAAELEADFREATSGGCRDPSAHLTRSSKADKSHVGMLHERGTCLLAKTMERGVHPRGNPCLAREHPKGPCRERCILGSLQNGGVAAQQRRKRLPGDVRDRRIRRDDQPGDANWLAHHHRRLVRHGAGRGLTVEPAAFPGNEKPHFDRRVGLAERVLA